MIIKWLNNKKEFKKSFLYLYTNINNGSPIGFGKSCKNLEFEIEFSRSWKIVEIFFGKLSLKLWKNLVFLSNC